MITRTRFVCAQCRTLLTRSISQARIDARLRTSIARVRLYATLPVKPIKRVNPTRVSKPPAYKPKERTLVFPSSLRIYAPSLVRVGGVAILKASFVFVFLGTCLLVVPHAYRVQTLSGERNWLQLGALYLLGATPFLLYSVLSAPFVANISLHLPKHVRTSKELVYRHVEHLPSNTYITITTMRLLPVQKTKDVYLKDLRFRRDKRWSLANIERVGSRDNSQGEASWKQAWRRWTPLFRRQYHVDPKFDEFKAAVEDRIPLPGIWEAVKMHIKANSPKAQK